MRPTILLREIAALIQKVIVLTLWTTLGIAIVGGVASAWTSLDTSYVDLPNASITLRQSADWIIALAWRALVTWMAFFAVRGCWRRLKFV
jgi:hypothetical protein